MVSKRAPAKSNAARAVGASAVVVAAAAAAPALTEAERKKAQREEEKKKKAQAAAQRKAEATRKKAAKEAAAVARKAATEARKAEAARKRIEKEQEKDRKKAEREEAKRKKEEEKAAAAAAVKPKLWQHSKARKMLKYDLENGTITHEKHHPINNPTGTKVEDAYRMRPEFQQYPLDKFTEYLESLQQSIFDNKNRAVRDANAVAQFRQINPKPTHNHRGEPRWEGSAAEAQLKADVANGVHLQKSPAEMRASTPVYQSYKPRTISNHIDQEIRATKFKTWLNDKNEKKKKDFAKK